MSSPTLEELRNRIQETERYYGGTLPREAALVWDGYLAVLIEWGLLSVSDHATLSDMLPKGDVDPVLQIVLGWESPDERPEWLDQKDA
jgi:hypothetical protein